MAPNIRGASVLFDVLIIAASWKFCLSYYLTLLIHVLLVDQIFDVVKPSRITIGEYRPAIGLSNHIKDRFSKSPLLKVNGSLIREEGKLRYPRKRRVEMFHTIASRIRRHDKAVDIALCKENAEVWKAVGLKSNGLCCNCLG